MSPKAYRIIFWSMLLLAVVIYAASGWLVYARWFTRHVIPLVAHEIQQIKAPIPVFPGAIVIHHTATPPVVNGRKVDVGFIDALHERRHFHVLDSDGKTYHIGYHFLVLQDGTVLPGRPEHLHGAHTRGYPDTLGIALVGNFQHSSNKGNCGPEVPPPAQMAALENLTRALMSKYHLPVSRVHLHRDMCKTACPGDGFPRAKFFAAISQPMKRVVAAKQR